MNKHGFTLVEVLIVVIIIGILAAIGIPQFSSAIEKAKGGEARAGLGFIQTAEKIYFAENDAYPAALSQLTDLSLSQKYWTFTAVGTSTGYTSTATRVSGGQYNAQTLIMDSAGTVTGTWAFK